MPKEYVERRPRTSYLMGQGLGQALGKASDLYLQNKVQGYFDEQKEARLGEKQKISGTALANALGMPEKANYISQLPIAMQQALIKPKKQGGAGGLSIAGPDYTSSFSGIGGPPKEQPVKTTNVVPGLPPERGVAAEQNKAYQTEAEALRPQESSALGAGGIEAPEAQEPVTMEDKLRNDWQNKQDEIDALHNALLQQHPEHAESINDAYNAATKQNSDKNDRLMKNYQNQINRESESIKAQDTATRKDIDTTNAKAESAKEMVEVLDGMEEVIDEGYTGPLGGVKSFFNPEKRIEARNKIETLRLALLNIHRTALAKGITSTEFPFYEDILPNVEYTEAANRAKLDAYRLQLGHYIQRQKVYDSIQKPDGSFPKDASKMVNQLMAESKKDVKKTVREARKQNPKIQNSIEGAKENDQFSALPSDAKEGDRFKTKNGQIVRMTNGNWKIVG